MYPSIGSLETGIRVLSNNTNAKETKPTQLRASFDSVVVEIQIRLSNKSSREAGLNLVL